MVIGGGIALLWLFFPVEYFLWGGSGTIREMALVFLGGEKKAHEVVTGVAGGIDEN